MKGSSAPYRRTLAGDAISKNSISLWAILQRVRTYPVNILAHVEYAVMAWSCSPSRANVCANAIQAGPNLGSMSDVLLQRGQPVGYGREKAGYHLKYVRASAHFCCVRYQTPTAYQLMGDSGSRSTSSCARMKSLECRCLRWCMQAICKGIVGACTATSPSILRDAQPNTLSRSIRRRLTVK